MHPREEGEVWVEYGWVGRQEHGPGRVNPAWKCEGGVHHRLSCLPAYRTYCRLIKEKVQGMGPGKARPMLDLATPSSLGFHTPVKGLPRHSCLGAFRYAYGYFPQLWGYLIYSLFPLTYRLALHLSPTSSSPDSPSSNIFDLLDLFELSLIYTHLLPSPQATHHPTLIVAS